MEAKELKREIGVWGLSSNLINTMVGAGIFALPAIVYAGLGGASIVAYLFCGFLITLVVLCFAEVGSIITDSGGVYAYIEGTFGKYFGFVTSILFLLATSSADAAVANAIADVIASISPLFYEKYVRILFFLVVFAGLAYVNILGVKEGIRFVKVITVTKLVPLLFLVFVGFSHVSGQNLVWEGIPSVKNIGEMSLLLFFAFQGVESGLSVSGEVKNPQKTIPRAILISIFAVLVLYILIQTVAQGILGVSLTSYSGNPLSEVASTIAGPFGFTLLTIGAAVSMFGYLSSELLSIPRVLYGASKDNVIPFKWFSSIHKKHATPHISIAFYAAVGFIFASSGGFQELAILSSASMLLIYLGISLAVIKLRTMKTLNLGYSFKIPGGFTVPILSSVVILWLLSHLAIKELIVIAISIVGLSVLYGLINFKEFRIYFKK